MVPVALILAVTQIVNLPTSFTQVAPTGGGFVGLARSDARQRAVVLIHGLHLHPLAKQRITQAELAPWQRANSDLVRLLGREADVFAFSYAQTVPVGMVSHSPALALGIEHLKESGYAELILVGFSAGGIVARDFAEANPRSGVTRVVQICAPNGGSEWARWPLGIPKCQEPFVRSLTPQSRQRNRIRAEVPDGLEMVCVVGRVGKSTGDGVVRCDRQWTEDLQSQRIPAVFVPFGHLEVMVKPASVARIAEVVLSRARRWDDQQVEAARRLLPEPTRGK
jgi:pimeloyl-ACP methyl ester carboxylesterase